MIYEKQIKNKDLPIDGSNTKKEAKGVALNMVAKVTWLQKLFLLKWFQIMPKNCQSIILVFNFCVQITITLLCFVQSDLTFGCYKSCLGLT